MNTNESRFHYNSKLIVKRWLLEELLELSYLDILPVYEFPVTEDNVRFKCKHEYAKLFLYTPENWYPSRRKDIFNSSYHEIDYIFDWTGVQWWQKDLPPTYEELINEKKQVYVIFDIGLISEGEFCVEVPFLNPQCKQDLFKADLPSMLLGAIEIEHKHTHTSNKKIFIDKLPFEVLNLTTDEILVSPDIGKSKFSYYLKELAAYYW